MRYTALGLLSLLLMAPAAKAEWFEASSDHFLIYADQNPKSVREFAERLEFYHSLLELSFGMKATKPSVSNRVTIFALHDDGKVRELFGTDDDGVRGFYLPRAGASLAVVPRLKRSTSKFRLSGEDVLFHEYAHHFMFASFPNRTYPRWFVEGFAEFYSGVEFESKGKILLGVPPYYRTGELYYADKVPIHQLLDFDGSDSKAEDSFYVQSWLLFHYLRMDRARDGQFLKYVRLLGQGRAALVAAEEAFGDLAQLEKDMSAYIKQRKLSAMVFDQALLSIGTIAVRELRPGESAMMPVKIKSDRGVTREQALALVPAARKVAAQFPDDPMVLDALAEAEFDAGFDDAAIAAADRALSIDPKNMNALLQKGYALEHKVATGVLPKEAWKDVRRHYTQANKIENDHPIPLVHFYVSFLGEEIPPTKNAIAGLEWAMHLAPFDASLRWLVVQQMVKDERFEEAAVTLAPLAYSPHPGEGTAMARNLLKEIEAKIVKPQASGTAKQ